MKSFFGVSLDVILEIDKILLLHSQKREHLLWALHFLKNYDTESVACSRWGVTEKTYRKHVMQMVHNIAEMDLVRLMMIGFLFWNIHGYRVVLSSVSH